MSNVNISGAFGADASVAEITNAWMFISMSSSVSRKMSCIVVTAVFIASVEMPTAPIHSVSLLPMANNAVLILPIRGVSLVV